MKMIFYLFDIYRKDWVKFLGYSLKALMWCIVPLITIGVSQQFVTKSYIAIVIAIVGLICSPFCLARMCLNLACISRHSYTLLIQESEVIISLHQSLLPIKWNILRLNVYASLRAFLSLTILFVISISIITILNFLSVPIQLLNSVAAILGGICAFLFYYFVFFNSIAELPLVTGKYKFAKECLNHMQSISNIYSNGVFKTFVILIIINLPLSINLLIPASSNQNLEILRFFMSIFLFVLLIPLSQIAKSILYLKLQSQDVDDKPKLETVNDKHKLLNAPLINKEVYQPQLLTKEQSSVETQSTVPKSIFRKNILFLILFLIGVLITVFIHYLPYLSKYSFNINITQISNEEGRLASNQLEPQQKPSEIDRKYTNTTQPPPESSVTPNEIPSKSFKFPMESCGTPEPGGRNAWYPVYINFTEQDLSIVKTKYCKDAFFRYREDVGKKSIQVASFIDRSKAEELASLLKRDLRSVEIGKSSLYPPEDSSPSNKLGLINASRFPTATCGNSKSTSSIWYPVYVELSDQNLSLIQSTYCKDAFIKYREKISKESIQVASFENRSDAEIFAFFMQNKVGSGEVGQP